MDTPTIVSTAPADQAARIAAEHLARQSGTETAVDAAPPQPALDVANGAEEAGEAASRHILGFRPGARKVAIVGFTPTRQEAMSLLDDDEWTCWGMNNLHLQPDVAPHVAKFDAWFDLHPARDIATDAPHVAWLKDGAAGVPVFMWQQNPEWPTSVLFPTDEATARFGRYFTNSVSWMLALALMGIMAESEDGERAPEGASIAVMGIDMATDSEYASQRPSVEYFLGVAAGVGVEVVLPERSDLLKSAALYGHDDGGLRAKLEERKSVLTQQLAQHEQQLRQSEANAHAARGALQQVDYLMGVWTQPTIDRDNPANQPSQDGASP